MLTSTAASFDLIRLGYRLPMLAGKACIVGTMVLLTTVPRTLLILDTAWAKRRARASCARASAPP